MVSDIIIIAVVILFIIIGARRGIAKSLLNLAGLAVNAIVTSWLSSLLAQWIYDAFIKQGVVSNLESTISQNGITYAAATSLDAVPKWIHSLTAVIVGIFGMNPDDIQRTLYVTEEQSKTVAQTIEQPVGRVVVSVLSILLMIVIFLLLLIVIKRFIKIILKFFNIPVIKQINHFFGAVLGAVEGIVFSWLAINLFYVIMTYTNPVFTENQMFFGKIFSVLCMFV